MCCLTPWQPHFAPPRSTFFVRVRSHLLSSIQPCACGCFLTILHAEQTSVDARSLDVWNRRSVLDGLGVSQCGTEAPRTVRARLMFSVFSSLFFCRFVRVCLCLSAHCSHHVLLPPWCAVLCEASAVPTTSPTTLRCCQNILKPQLPPQQRRLPPATIPMVSVTVLVIAASLLCCETAVCSWLATFFEWLFFFSFSFSLTILQSR